MDFLKKLLLPLAVVGAATMESCDSLQTGTAIAQDGEEMKTLLTAAAEGKVSLHHLSAEQKDLLQNNHGTHYSALTAEQKADFDRYLANSGEVIIAIGQHAVLDANQLIEGKTVQDATVWQKFTAERKPDGVRLFDAGGNRTDSLKFNPSRPVGRY